jgi:ketosteroid isomerase-like protein
VKESDEVTDHRNALLYRRAAQAFRDHDMETLRDLIAPDVVWHVPGANRMSGEVRGWDALVAWFARLREVTSGTFTLEEHDVLGSSQHVVALSVMGAVRDGSPVFVRVISVFHYGGGRQRERWFQPDDMEAWDRMLA